MKQVGLKVTSYFKSLEMDYRLSLKMRNPGDDLIQVGIEYAIEYGKEVASPDFRKVDLNQVKNRLIANYSRSSCIELL